MVVVYVSLAAASAGARPERPSGRGAVRLAWGPPAVGLLSESCGTVPSTGRMADWRPAHVTWQLLARCANRSSAVGAVHRRAPILVVFAQLLIQLFSLPPRCRSLSRHFSEGGGGQHGGLGWAFPFRVARRRGVGSSSTASSGRRFPPESDATGGGDGGRRSTGGGARGGARQRYRGSGRWLLPAPCSVSSRCRTG